MINDKLSKDTATIGPPPKELTDSLASYKPIYERMNYSKRRKYRILGEYSSPKGTVVMVETPQGIILDLPTCVMGRENPILQEIMSEINPPPPPYKLSQW